ncbi:MAG: hypothetical protein HUU31_25965 [Anaerolineae bacterium]|nr:hypothetical protein [Anaerolineae bacterium]
MILNNTLPGYIDPLAVEAATPGTETSILTSGSSILVAARWNVFPNIVLGSYPSFPLNQFWFNSGEGNVTLPDGEDCNDLPQSSGGSFAVHIVSDDTGTREWAVWEGEEIIHALTRIGAAFGTISHVQGSSAVDAFNRVFTSIPAQYPPYIMLVRANSSADSPLRPANQSNTVNDPSIPDVTVEFYLGSELHQGFYLDVQRGNCKSFEAQVAVVEINGVNRSVNMPYAIVCNGELLNSTLNTSEPPSPVPGEASQHTIVHEFGHIFDYIADDAFTNEIGAMLVLASCRTAEFGGAPYRIMYTDPINGAFRRGARGWGSAPPFSRFIQSPESSVYLEASADFFLNWIYRVNDDSNPTVDGISRTAEQPPALGCVAVDDQPATSPQVEYWSGFWNRTPNNDQPITAAPYDWGLPGEVRFRLVVEIMQSIFAQPEHTGW